MNDSLCQNRKKKGRLWWLVNERFSPQNSVCTSPLPSLRPRLNIAPIRPLRHAVHGRLLSWPELSCRGFLCNSLRAKSRQAVCTGRSETFVLVNGTSPLINFEKIFEPENAAFNAAILYFRILLTRTADQSYILSIDSCHIS